MRVALDTNVLAYLFNVERVPEDADKIDVAPALIEKLASRVTIVVATQVLGELFNLLVKTGARREDARDIVNVCTAKFEIVASASTTFLKAADLATDHRLQIWDALILCTAAEAGCSLFLSEDLNDGFVISGITVANPFATSPHPKLAALLSA